MASLLGFLGDMLLVVSAVVVYVAVFIVAVAVIAIFAGWLLGGGL